MKKQFLLPFFFVLGLTVNAQGFLKAAASMSKKALETQSATSTTSSTTSASSMSPNIKYYIDTYVKVRDDKNKYLSSKVDMELRSVFNGFLTLKDRYAYAKADADKPQYVVYAQILQEKKDSADLMENEIRNLFQVQYLSPIDAKVNIVQSYINDTTQVEPKSFKSELETIENSLDKVKDASPNEAYQKYYSLYIQLKTDCSFKNGMMESLNITEKDFKTNNLESAADNINKAKFNLNEIKTTPWLITLYTNRTERLSDKIYIAISKQIDATFNSYNVATKSIENINEIDTLYRIAAIFTKIVEKDLVCNNNAIKLSEEKIKSNTSSLDAVRVVLKDLEQKKREKEEAVWYAGLVKQYGKINADKIRDGKVEIGFSRQMCIEAWGRPDEINRIALKGINQEQFVYNEGSFKYRFLYILNGKLDLIQD